MMDAHEGGGGGIISAREWRAHVGEDGGIPNARNK